MKAISKKFKEQLNPINLGSIDNQLYAKFCMQVTPKLCGELWHQLYGQVYDQCCEQLKSQLYDQLNEQFNDKTFKTFLLSEEF